MNTIATPQNSVSISNKTLQQDPLSSSSGEISPPTSTNFGGKEVATTADLFSVEVSKERKTIADAAINFFFRPPKSSTTTTTLRPIINDKRQVSVETEDGYSINFKGTRQEWTITSPEGKTTTIWGDPHVIESDGDKWDFTEQSSFRFGDNKITVQTTPYGNGQTLTDTVSIYNGQDRFTITDIDTNDPKIVDWKLDAKSHDLGLDDGNSYQLLPEAGGGEKWD